MLTHERIWLAIDMLAQRENLSPSSLARLAGLDASIFNPSKRFLGNGRPRWPSTESIARILSATGLSTEAFFVELLGERRCVVWPYQDILAQIPASDIPHLFLETETPEPSIKRGETETATTSCPSSPPEARQLQKVSDPAERVFVLQLETDDFVPYFKKKAILLLGIFCPAQIGDRVIYFGHAKQAKSKELMLLGDIVSGSDDRLYIRPLTQAGLEEPVLRSNERQIAKILWASQ